MNKIAILMTAVLLTVAYNASASEVAEAAKKEKARREAIRKEGKPSKTFTNQDVSDLKSTLAFESSTPENEAPADPAAQPTQITTIPTVDPDLGQPAQPES